MAIQSLQQITITNNINTTVPNSINTKKKMSDDDDDELEVYVYRGNKGEKVPETVGKLIVSEGVEVLPEKLCYEFADLQEVTLPNGLIKIGIDAFGWCESLLEISICSTVQYIGHGAFGGCVKLGKVEFEDYSTTSSSHHRQLQTIDGGAFSYCTSLLRIKLPSSVNVVGQDAFYSCSSLIEANLSTTGPAEISNQAFHCCSSLQTVSLSNTVERIEDCAFYYCRELVTVVVPPDSKSIIIGRCSFGRCRQLANLVLPKDSNAEDSSFDDCELLHKRYGEDSSHVVAGLIGRFENFPIHKMCYDHSGTIPQKLRQSIAEQPMGDSLVDMFEMTPFHVLLSTPEPSMKLLEILLNSLPNQMLKWKDSTGHRPLDYLIQNWTGVTKSLLLRTLENWMIDPMVNWGATKWADEVKSKAGVLLFEDGSTEQRMALFNKAYALFEHYENVQATSILEMALWKWKLKSGRTTNGSKRQALDRDECRCLSGSDVVIPFLLLPLSWTFQERTS